jgi:hypothetical protein
MPPQPWATKEQLDFLIGEDSKWESIKSGGTMLKSFYTSMTQAFLQKWPTTPDKVTLERAGRNTLEAQQLAEEKVHSVSELTHIIAPPSNQFHSESTTGLVIDTAERSRSWKSRNRFLTLVENTCGRVRCFRNGRHFHPSITDQKILQYVQR